MKVKTCLLLGAVLLLVAPTWAQTTYWGGFEDTAGGSSDYDYNDLVFSMTGSSLKLMSTGTWNSQSNWIPSDIGSPFWNNVSYDPHNLLPVNNDNVGDCIYLGCQNNNVWQTALASSDLYLAASNGASVNDVYFSVDGNVSETITLHIADDNDTLGWYTLTGAKAGQVVYLDGTNSACSGDTCTIDPEGNNFAIVGNNGGETGQLFTSDAGLAGTTGDNGINHFAWFGQEVPAVPEPNSIVLLGTLLLGVAGVLRRRKAA